MSNGFSALILCVFSLTLIQCKQPEQPKIQGSNGTNFTNGSIVGGAGAVKGTGGVSAQINSQLSQDSLNNLAQNQNLPAPEANSINSILSSLSGGSNQSSGGGLFSGGLLGGLLGNLFSGAGSNVNSGCDCGNCGTNSVSGGCNCGNCSNCSQQGSFASGGCSCGNCGF